jgi:hypothetical protein
MLLSGRHRGHSFWFYCLLLLSILSFKKLFGYLVGMEPTTLFLKTIKLIVLKNESVPLTNEPEIFSIVAHS